jgi:hypothetical protein
MGVGDYRSISIYPLTCGGGEGEAPSCRVERAYYSVIWAAAVCEGVCVSSAWRGRAFSCGWVEGGVGEESRVYLGLEGFELVVGWFSPSSDPVRFGCWGSVFDEEGERESEMGGVKSPSRLRLSLGKGGSSQLRENHRVERGEVSWGGGEPVCFRRGGWVSEGNLLRCNEGFE